MEGTSKCPEHNGVQLFYIKACTNSIIRGSPLLKFKKKNNELFRFHPPYDESVSINTAARLKSDECELPSLHL